MRRPVRRIALGGVLVLACRVRGAFGDGNLDSGISVCYG
jgi:hypothetical protein